MHANSIAASIQVTGLDNRIIAFATPRKLINVGRLTLHGSFRVHVYVIQLSFPACTPAKPLTFLNSPSHSSVYVSVNTNCSRNPTLCVWMSIGNHFYHQCGMTDRVVTVEYYYTETSGDLFVRTFIPSRGTWLE